MASSKPGKPCKVFDWERAAHLLQATGATTAVAGLYYNWHETKVLLIVAGKPVAVEPIWDAKLGSEWDTPILTYVDAMARYHEIDCFLPVDQACPIRVPPVFWPVVDQVRA